MTPPLVLEEKLLNKRLAVLVLGQIFLFPEHLFYGHIHIIHLWKARILVILMIYTNEGCPKPSVASNHRRNRIT